MNAKITVTCYRSRILSNGESPLMVKITKNGKRSLKSLGISLNPRYWDFERDKPKGNCPNRTYITNIITNAIHKLDMEMKDEDYSASTLFQETDNHYRQVTLEEFLTSHITMLRENGKVGNSYAYLNLRTTLHNFYGNFNSLRYFGSGQPTMCNKQSPRQTI